MTEIMDGQVGLFDAGTASGRTSQAHSVPTKDATSKRSLRSSSGSQIKTLPMCLCLTRGSGPNQDGCTMKWVDGAWPGESMTLSSGVYRSDENGLLWLQTSGGVSAPEILFDPEYRGETERTESDETEPDSGGERGLEVQTVEQSLSGDIESCGTQGQGTPAGTESGVDGAISFQERAGKPGGARESLSRLSEQDPCQP